jgi:hypothetical protein
MQYTSEAPSRQLKAFLLVVSALVFGYVLVRAITVPLTYDEVYTFDLFLHISPWEVISYKVPVANNHVLNTLLVKAMYRIGPDTAFMARIPNVAAGGIYLFFAYRIATRFFGKFFAVSCFLLLIMNPFLLDFFSLARGYGLSMAFLLASLYHLIRYIRELRQPSAMPALLYGFLAVTACFSLFNYWLIICAAFFLLPLLKRKAYPRRSPFIVYFLLLVGVAALIYEPVRKMREAGELYYGGNTGIYSDTLVSLAKFTFYEGEATPTVIAFLNGSIMLLTVAVLAAIWFRREWLTPANALTAVLLLCLLAVVLQFHLTGTLYILDRTALYLYPLFTLALCFAFADVPGKRVAGIPLAVSLLFAVNTLRHLSLHRTALWFFDSHSEEILTNLDGIGRREGRVLKVGYSYVFRSTFQYHLKNGNFKNLTEREIVNGEPQPCDFYVYLARPLDVVWIPEKDEILRRPRKEIGRYGKDGVIVYRLPQ